MPNRKAHLIDALQVRLAVATDRRRRSRVQLQTKRTMTLLLGAALSAGGVGQAFEDTHFIVQKDLDRVRVVRQSNGQEKVVAEVKQAFAANSVYKLAQAAPDSLVSRRSELYDQDWFDRPTLEALASVKKKSRSSSLGEKVTLINDEIREQFFKANLPYGDIIHEKAQKYDVDPALVAAVMEAESRFKHRATSPVGARGLMQLMPRTGRWMGAKNLYDPEQNVDAGAKYLKYLDKRFDGNLKKTIAAYNAGEGNVMRYNGIPPFRETRTYVKRVLKNYEKRNAQLKRYSREVAAEESTKVAASDRSTRESSR